MLYKKDFKHRDTHEARTVDFNYFEKNGFTFHKILEHYKLSSAN